MLASAATLATGLCLIAGAGVARADLVTFLPTGGEQTFTVPAGVTSIHMVAIGGRGGDGAPRGDELPGGTGGFGAIVSADISVTPGQLLYVEVAGNGADATSGGAGGFNGGGEGGEASETGGGGGGASDVRLGPRAAGTSLSSRLIVAGGGGGGGGGNPGPGYTNGGGSGGSPATAGSDEGGSPGTETEGGEGNCKEGDGGPGFGGAGGTYDRCEYFGYGGGGGGGGGLFGGGGGAFSSAGGGGGGGSSGFAPGVATNTSIATDSTGAPAIAISFTPSPAPAPTTQAPVLTPPPTADVKCHVPRLGGRKLKGARKALGKANCKLGRVRRKDRDSKHVVAQSPKPGASLPAGSKVNVTLGS